MGAGNDRLVLDYADQGGYVVLSGPTGTLAEGYSGTVDTNGGPRASFSGVENFTVLGSTTFDILTTGDGADVLSGNDGDDTLKAGGGSDSVSGGAGNDSLTGGDGRGAALRHRWRPHAGLG